MIKINKVKVATALGILAVGSLVGIIMSNQSKTMQTIELMDLYGQIAPYGDMAYGDRYLADMIFDPLINVNDKFELECKLASNYTVEGSNITVKFRNKYFKLPDGSAQLNNEYMEEYFNNLIRLSDSDLITNPGIKNIKSFEVSGNEISVEFNSEKPSNILAFTENIGYQLDGYWYGTEEAVEYLNDTSEILVGNDKYITSDTKPGLNSDKRITNMVLGNVLSDGTFDIQKAPNNAYGFITWGPAGIEKFSKDAREVIFDALENMGIRDSVTIKSDSIYSNTKLYKPVELNKNATADALNKLGITVNKSINIGVVDMGSFSEVQNAITDALAKLSIPVIIDEVSLNDLVSNTDYDLIYVRLERGKSPDFTGLFSETGILGRLDYLDDYSTYITNINKSKTWEEMCGYLSDLDYKLRDDGVWKFLDQGYDIIGTKNKS